VNRTPLAVHRFVAGLTQEQLAERVGMRAASICAIERGRAKPQRRTAIALGRALDLAPSELFGSEYRDLDDRPEPQGPGGPG